jgi:hypothetical protein
MTRRSRILLAGAVALVLGLLSAALMLRPVDAQSGLADAQARWEARGLERYRIRLTQQTNRSACDQEMVTADGKATAVRNSCGQPATWTVPRLFAWIAELESDPVQCYPDQQMCACTGSTSTTVRYDPERGFPREIVYAWYKRPNLSNGAYWRSLFDQSFPGCNRDGRGGPVVVSITLTEEP